MIYWTYILSLFAMWFFYKSYISYRNRSRLLLKGIIANAYVSEIKIEEEFDAETGAKILNEIPFMTYIDRNENEHTFRIQSTSYFAKYHLNEKYKLVYDPDGENEPMIMTRFGMWGDVMGYFACGLFLILFAVWNIKMV